MATASNTVYPNYTSLASIKDYWVNQIAPNFFDFENTNNYNVGIFGYVNEVMGETTEDAFNATAISRREFYPVTAQFTSSLYAMATLQNVDIPLTKPAVCKVLLAIPQDEVIRYSTMNAETGMYEMVIDNNLKIFAGELQFMLDYPIKILTRYNSIAKTYTHTVHYDVTVKNTLNTSDQRYISHKIFREEGVNYIALFIDTIRQLEMSEQTNVVVKDTILDTVTMDIDFDGNLANFEVFYKETVNSEEMQLTKVMINARTPGVPYVQYELVNNSKLRLTFAYNTVWIPKFNSEIITRIYTSQGSNGNFNQFLDNLVCSSDSEEYPYNANLTIIGQVSGSATGGEDQMITEQFRNKVLKAYATNETIVTANDLQLYFDDIADDINGVNILFKKKRDDIFIRLFGAYAVFKDEYKNVIPTNTLETELLRSNLTQDLSDTSLRYVIPTGATFVYRNSSDYIVKPILNEDGSIMQLIDLYGNYIDKIAVLELDNAVLTDDYGACIDTETIKPLSTLIQRSGSTYDDEGTTHVFTLPFLAVINTNPNNVGYYLNSVKQNFALEYLYIDDRSEEQFIATSSEVYRDAILGDNFYKISIGVLPASDLEDEDYIAHYNDPEDEANQIRAESAGIVLKEELYYDEELQASYVRYTVRFDHDDGLTNIAYIKGSNIHPIYHEDLSDDDRTGYKMKFSVGDTFSTGDVLATRRPTDKGTLMAAGDIKNFLLANDYYIPFSIQDYDAQKGVYTLEAFIETNDDIDLSSKIIITRGIYNTSGVEAQSLAIPMRDLTLKISALFINIDANFTHEYAHFRGLNKYTLTNSYLTSEDEPFDFAKPLSFVRSNCDFLPIDAENPEENNDYKIIIDEIPYLGAAWAYNRHHFDYFIEQYTLLNNVLNGAYYTLENTFSIDSKFYNTYGRARFFEVGNTEDDMQKLNSVRCSFSFGVKLATISNQDQFVERFRLFVKEYVEHSDRITTDGQDIYVLNMIAAMKEEFSEIDYIEYYGFNIYNHMAQKIVGPDMSEFIEDFIPEFLNLNVVMDGNGNEYPDVTVAIL